MVANVIRMLTCIVHTSLCVWGVWMTAGLHTPLILVCLVACWTGHRNTRACEDFLPHRISGPTCMFSVRTANLTWKKGVALNGVWARCPPEVPSNLNYNSIHLVIAGFLLPSSEAPWCCLLRQNIGQIGLKYHPSWQVLYSMCKQDLLETQYILNVGL